jgi:hypothetical protein
VFIVGRRADKNVEWLARLDLAQEDRAEAGDYVKLMAGRALEFRAYLFQYGRNRSGSKDFDFSGIRHQDL